MTAIRRAVLLDPDNPKLRFPLINHIADSTDYGAAITAAAEAIQRFPEEVRFRVHHAVLVAHHTGDVTLCRRVRDEVPPWVWLYWRYRPGLLFRGVFTDTEQAVDWIEAADPASHSYTTAPSTMNYAAGIHLLVGGNAEGARLRFKAAYARYSARLDAGGGEAYQLIRLGRLSLLAALAGEQEAAQEQRQRARDYAAAIDDVLTANELRREAAFTLAVLGEAEEAWRELEPLIGKPRGPTEWDLILRIDIHYFFADSEGYQARVAQLEERK